MRKASTQAALWGGIDTAKAELVLAALGEPKTVPVANSPAGFPAMIAYFQSRGVTRVGIESTSKYHRPAAKALREAGIVVSLLQPLQVKRYAEFRLQRAKSDALDAHIIARCAADLGEPRPAPDERLEALAEHQTLIDQIGNDIACLKTRCEGFQNPRFLAVLHDQIDRLETVLREERKLLKQAVLEHADLARRYELIESVQGIGEKTALMLVIRMPELGSVSREQAASLLGVAPYVHQSGQYEGQRRTGGGRARARTGQYAAAQAAKKHNPVLGAFYNRLRKAGKPHALAIVACVRKLVIYANTVLARGTPWVKINQPIGAT